MLQDLYLSNSFEPSEKVRLVTEIYDILNIKFISEKVVAEYLKSALGYLEKVTVAHERKEELVSMVESLAGRDH
jgi:geranylgeranyl diphosphate synthase type II